MSLYLATTPDAMSAALIGEEGKEQRPVYYVSRALRGAEARYPKIELIAFIIVTLA